MYKYINIFKLLLVLDIYFNMNTKYEKLIISSISRAVI